MVVHQSKLKMLITALENNVDNEISSEKQSEIIDVLFDINIKDKNLFITGETGVGKSLIGKLIHDFSYTEEAPFIQYYDLLKREIPALSQSKLEITMVPGKITCVDCGKESLISSEIELLCKDCGSGQTTIIGGTDVIIKNLKI